MKTRNVNQGDKFNYAKVHTNWTNPDYTYLRNVKITEYDIKSAGLSVIKFKKILPEDEIQKLEKMDKHKRTVKEGWLQRSNPAIANAIVDTLGNVRKAFVFLNNIPIGNVISIKKDALFLVNTNPTVTTIKDVFEFRKKSTYTSYLRLNKIEFYYSSLTDTLDIKGLSSDAINRQERYLLKDIKQILKSAEKLDSTSLYRFLKNYRSKYLNRLLDKEYYRELDSGRFRIGSYLLTEIDDEMLQEVDVSQNYIGYILPIINMLL